MFETWLPRWKWSSSKLSRMPTFRMKSIESSSSLDDRPNLLRSPPEASHLPAPRVESFTRMPIRGRMPTRRDTSAMRGISLGFSTTSTTLRPSREA